MSTSVIEPGTRLAGRFRCDDRISEAGGSTFWKATDEILARPVAVLTFAPGSPRVHDVVTAARAASRLTDPRLTQVFDADDGGEQAYVVSEWVTGDTLEDLLAKGPMEPDRAASFLLEAAEAVASANAAGLPHLCLTPRNLVWTSGGTVKVTGLGVDAVLSGATSPDPALEDAQGVGRMLYAALTGHWPGPPEVSTLPPAPTANGVPLLPSQVKAGIPHLVDTVVARALQIELRGGQGGLVTPAAVADALSEVPRTPLPFVPLMSDTPPAVIPRPADPAQTGPMEMPSAPQPRVQQAPPPVAPTTPQRHAAAHGGPGHGVSKQMIAIIVAVALVVVIAGGYGLSKLGSNGKPGKGNNPAAAKPPAKKADTKVKPTGATGFDPTSSHPDSSLPKSPDNAIDGDPGTYWTTQWYGDAHFGRYKKGLGLRIELPESTAVGKVKVVMPPAGQPGSVELRVGDSGDASMTKVGSGDASGTFEISGKSARGKYVLLWFTKLPNIGQFQIKVKDVTVYRAS